jgi:type III pantothenate kinase
MLILLDIGNTSVTYGVHRKDRLTAFGSVLFDALPNKINKWLSSGGSSTINLIISSVVPKNTQKLKKMYGRKKNLRLYIAGQNLPVPIKHKYRHLNQLGIDRRVNVYGASRLYKLPLLVIDYGTAITFDYVSRKGVFEGGLIIPGPGLAFQALIQRAAQISDQLRLPAKAPHFLGRTTYDCISSGVLEGYGAMTDGLVQRFRKRLGKGLRVLATGGFTSHLKKHTRSFDIVDSKLSVKSLLLLYRDQAAR